MAPQLYPVPKNGRCGLSFLVSPPVLDLLYTIRSETKERPGEVYQRLMYLEQGRREPRARILPCQPGIALDARQRHKNSCQLNFTVSPHMYDLLHDILSETEERPGELFQHLMYQELGRREGPAQTRERVLTALEAS